MRVTKLANEQQFFDEITQKYIKQFQRVSGVKQAFLQQQENILTGHKCLFTIYLETNEDDKKKRYFTKKLDYIQRNLNKICFNRDKIQNIIMPYKIKQKDKRNECSYKYETDYVTFEIFICNEAQK